MSTLIKFLLAAFIGHKVAQKVTNGDNNEENN